jgi:hypothetical protein
MARSAHSVGATTLNGCSVFSMRLRQTFKRLDTGYPAVVMMCGQTVIHSLTRRPFSYRQPMIDSFARVSGWQQLSHLWQLIVMLCKFFWGLLRLLGGG